MSAILDLLKRARARIEKPEHWTQGHFARNARGEYEWPINSGATCWCALGAILAETRDPEEREAGWSAIERAARPLRSTAINDYGTHADVLAMYDRAIAKAEGEA